MPLPAIELNVLLEQAVDMLRHPPRSLAVLPAPFYLLKNYRLPPLKHGLLSCIGLKAFFHVHLLETSVFVFKLF